MLGSAETSRRLACDATRVVMRHDLDGRVVEVGARTRSIPPALRRALQHRDRGCRFPGCGASFGQGHHIRHWAQGGPTTLSNLALLCRRHHRAVHEERGRIPGGTRARRRTAIPETGRKTCAGRPASTEDSQRSRPCAPRAERGGWPAPGREHDATHLARRTPRRRVGDRRPAPASPSTHGDRRVDREERSGQYPGDGGRTIQMLRRRS